MSSNLEIIRKILSSQNQESVREIELQLKSRALQHLDSNVSLQQEHLFLHNNGVVIHFQFKH